MLFLLFHIGRDRYALDAAHVVEVLPMVRHKAIPRAPAGVLGAFDYHGTPVPLIDLAALATGMPSRGLMSTRIFLVSYLARPGKTHLLGLLAERATEAIRRERDDFLDAGVAVDAAPYLGPVTMDARGAIQRIEVDRLLPPSIHEVLFREPAET
jgi:chemotaxis-related protein WspB